VPDPAPLTQQRLAVLQCLANDYTIIETAEQLEISLSSVRDRLRGALKALGVTTPTGAVAVAIQRGLIPGSNRAPVVLVRRAA
jgi:DNA-binding NarL/FixJ family response regulator